MLRPTQRSWRGLESTSCTYILVIASYRYSPITSHAPNATLAAARVEAWEGKEPGRDTSLALEPAMGKPTTKVFGTVRSGEES
jgi:hypothetical protein